MNKTVATICALAALLALAGCATTGYSLEEGAKLEDCEVRATSEELRFIGHDGYVAFKPNSTRASVDGAIALHLPSPVRREKDEYILEKRLLDRVVTPLLLRRPAKIKTIMIDPGHGGDAPGAPGTVVPEKTLNLAVALKLKAELEKRNFKVLMTRESDVALSLKERVRLAEISAPDLFVSIHHDASENRKARGYSAYAPRDCSRHPGESVALAAAIQREVVKLPEVIDRGVRFADFYVFRSPVPAVLIELGFTSNAEEEKLMNDPARQSAEAAAIASGIERYRAGTREKESK